VTDARDVGSQEQSVGTRCELLELGGDALAGDFEAASKPQRLERLERGFTADGGDMPIDEIARVRQRRRLARQRDFTDQDAQRQPPPQQTTISNRNRHSLQKEYQRRQKVARRRVARLPRRRVYRIG
jgi:hypothetical protein